MNVSNVTVDEGPSSNDDIVMCRNDNTRISRLSGYRLYFTWLDLRGVLQ